MRAKISTALFLAASVLALWAVAAFRPTSPYIIDTPYEYPVVPGTQEWIDLGSVRARREASQVPEELLQKMTTDALLLTVLEYPFLVDIYAFNTLDMGYQSVKKQCNGLREFISRPDCMDALSRYCEKVSSLDEEENTFEDYAAVVLYSAISAEKGTEVVLPVA